MIIKKDYILQFIRDFNTHNLQKRFEKDKSFKQFYRLAINQDKDLIEFPVLDMNV